MRIALSTGAEPVLSPATIDDQHNDRLLDASLLGVLVVSCLTFYWLTIHGTWRPPYNEVGVWNARTSHFFLAQAQAITRGRLWVPPAQLGDDCFVHAGKCYGYFGLTPSLLRLPFLAVLDHYKDGLTPVFVTAALTLATGSFLASLRHLFARMSLGRTTTFVVALIGLSFGVASVLTQLVPGNVYDEAVAWAVGFLSLAVYCFIRWWEGPQLRWYLLLLVSLVMATNARPTAVPFALAIGMGVGYRLWSLKGVGSKDRAKSVPLGALMVVIPIATCIGVFMLKVGQPIPSYLLNQQVTGQHASLRWVKIRLLDHNQLMSLRFIPTALFAYLRPDALHFTPTFPWVDFRFRSYLTPTGFAGPSITYVGLHKGSLYAETVSSLTATMPLVFLAALGAAACRLRWRTYGSVSQWLRSLLPGSRPLWKIIVLVAAVASWFVVLTGIAVEERFLGDAYPLMALVLLLSLPSLARALDRQGRLMKAGVVLIVVSGISWQLLVNLALTWRYP